LAADRSVCRTGLRHRRSDRAIINPGRKPLLRFLSLSALAGRVALVGAAISRPIPLPGGRQKYLRHVAVFRFTRRARFSPTCADCEMLSPHLSRVATLAASTEEAGAECGEASSVLRAVRRDIPATARQACRTDPRSRLLPVTDHAPRSFHHAAFRYR
jgi:thiol-disulfide isomerase/thioredoxin